MEHYDRVTDSEGRPSHGHSVYVEKPWNVEMLGVLVEIGEEGRRYKIVGIENNGAEGVYRLIVLPLQHWQEFLPETPRGGDL